VPHTLQGHLCVDCSKSIEGSEMFCRKAIVYIQQQLNVISGDLVCGQLLKIRPLYVYASLYTEIPRAYDITDIICKNDAQLTLFAVVFI
jgi:hypothetical protein